MYFKLEAPTQVSLHGAWWEADVLGLDPHWFKNTLTFNIGTGNIEKVNRLVKKYKLKVLEEQNYAPNELAYLYEGASSVRL